MGLLDNYTGIGMSPRPTNEHQAVLSNLIYGLRSDDIYAIPEASVDSENLNAKAPDINIYEDRGNRFPIIIIEITTKQERLTIINKVEDLLEQYPQIKEAFVYDYESNQWFAIFLKTEDNQGYKQDYSEILDLYLSDYLFYD